MENKQKDPLLCAGLGSSREPRAGSPGRGAAGAAAAEGAGPWGTPASAAFAGSTIMYGALLLFESEFVHIVAISFTSLILTELLMVALTIQTWHWLMTVAELLSLACYIASLVFLHEFIGKTPSPPPPPSYSLAVGSGGIAGYWRKAASPGLTLRSLSCRPWHSAAPILLLASPWGKW